MTAEWEMALQKIENNEADAGTFQKEMETYAKSITDELLQTSIAQNNLPKLVCPKCKGDLHRSHRKTKHKIFAVFLLCVIKRYKCRKCSFDGVAMIKGGGK